MAADDRLIIFTDLDGTLLDHETYDWRPAAPALAELRERGHWLILASSKTAAEIAPLREEIGFSHCPAIVENGAGILSAGNAATAGNEHSEIVKSLDSLPTELRACFSGFMDWDINEIVNRTGLSLEASLLAGKRQFSEPGLFSGTGNQKERFIVKLKERGITAQQGGRFLTLSFGATKADRMAEIIGQFRQDRPGITSLALGDAPNDITMLETADIGFVIANPAHADLPCLKGEAEGRIRRSVKSGPAGWNECVLSAINELDKKETGNANG